MMYKLEPWHDTFKFRAAALYFEAFGVYCKYKENSLRYRQFWAREKDRILNGVTIDGRYIDGDFYFYLNYVMIKLIKDSTFKSNGQAAVKILGFPKFWDLDAYYFNVVQEAVKTGKHLCVLKGRRKGFSYKNAALCVRRMYFYPNTKCFILAQREATLLDNDGILNKAWEILDHLDKHTPFKKRRQFKNTPMHKRASFKKVGDEAEHGYKSEIIGIAVGDDPDKVRGIDGTIVLYEEGGAFKKIKKVYKKVKDAVNQGAFVTGLQIVFGTAGTENNEDFEGLNDMFTNPADFGMMDFDLTCFNDPDLTIERGGFFVPQHWGYEGFIDIDGNSLIDKAYKHLYEIYENTNSRGNRDDTLSVMQENPILPTWALLSGSNNIFPISAINLRIQKLKSDPHKHSRRHDGWIERTSTGLRFIADPKAKPILGPKHIVTGTAEDTGCISIYQFPFKDKTGNIPNNLYYAVHDPYAGETGLSLGVTYIMKNVNPFSHPDNIIVARYVGRPPGANSTTLYNMNMFLLVEFFNAKLAFENDRGDVLSYAKINKKTHLLLNEFTFEHNAKIAKKANSLKYGFSVNSGRGGERKKQMLLWLADLLLEEIIIIDGQVLIFLDFVDDELFLNELIKWRDGLNFDCTSAMLGWPATRKELIYSQIKVRQNTEKSTIFQRNWF